MHYGRRKKDGGDEPIQVIIHTHMEMSQGNSLYSHLKQTKCHFFLLLQSQRTEGWKSGKGGGGGKTCRRVNVVEILCTHV
jgi:hypothetical protein